MNTPLTKKQNAVLMFMRRYTEENGYPPTLRDIAGHFGFRAIGTVQGYMRALIHKGYITHTPDQARAYIPVREKPHTPRPAGIPILGHIPAGAPLQAQELCIGELPCAMCTPATEETFALKVTGDSMLNAGIHDGDYVIVHTHASITQNAIVVARIHDEVTVKRFRRVDARRIMLIPENPAFSPQTYGEEDDLTLLGKVIAVYRSLPS